MEILIRIRAGSGLGDSIYLRVVAEHFVSRGERVTALTNFPDLFIGSGCNTEPFTRLKADVIAHYAAPKQKENPNTTQWEDICASAGISTPLSITWKVRNPDLVNGLRKAAGDRPLVLAHGGRSPWGRADGIAKQLMPERRAFLAALEAMGDCYTVRIGKGPELYPIATSANLNDRTSVSDLMDLGSACDAVVAQCSYAVPLAEVFDKQLIAVWASAGLKAAQLYVRQITPKKILSKASSFYVVDNVPDEQIQKEVREIRIMA